MMRECAYGLLLQAQRTDLHLEAALYFEQKLFSTPFRQYIVASYFSKLGQNSSSDNNDSGEILSIISDAVIVASHYFFAAISVSDTTDVCRLRCTRCAQRALVYILTAGLLFEEEGYVLEPSALFTQAQTMMESFEEKHSDWFTNCLSLGSEPLH